MPAIIALLRTSALLDIPNERSMHVIPMPRGGGVGVAVGAVSGLGASLLSGAPFDPALSGVVPLASVGLGIVGLIDDRRGLPTYVRLIAQVSAGVIIAGSLSTGSTISGPLLWCFAIVGVVWLAAYVNAFNFMDGINGISAMQSIACGGALVVIGTLWNVAALQVLGAGAIGASVGFLPYNFPSAKVYLGDAGSYFLGTWLSASALLGVATGVPLDVMVAPFAVYLADTGVTIMKRRLRGERLMSAHRSHTYQRIALAVDSHGRSAATVTTCSVACSVSVLWGSLNGTIGRAAGLAVATAVVSAYLAMPSLLEHRRKAVHT